jgi:NAD(P)H-flavin reductase
MAKVTAMINELSDLGGEIVVQAALERPLAPQPGQYFTAAARGDGDYLPKTLFPISAGGGQLRLLSYSKLFWHVGQEISLHGPLGNGFSIPAGAKRVGLFGLSQKGALALLPLAGALLESGKEVALVSNAYLQGLPLDLEILPGEQALEVNLWADSAAFAIERNEITELCQRYGLGSPRKSSEVLIMSEMPCGGISTCAVCAVPTKRGWKNACKEGPVFTLAELAVP